MFLAFAGMQVDTGSMSSAAGTLRQAGSLLVMPMVQGAGWGTSVPALAALCEDVVDAATRAAGARRSDLTELADAIDRLAAMWTLLESGAGAVPR
jgi:hypothetical protein